MSKRGKKKLKPSARPSKKSKGNPQKKNAAKQPATQVKMPAAVRPVAKTSVPLSKLNATARKLREKRRGLKMDPAPNQTGGGGRPGFPEFPPAPPREDAKPYGVDRDDGDGGQGKTVRMAATPLPPKGGKSAKQPAGAVDMRVQLQEGSKTPVPKVQPKIVAVAEAAAERLAAPAVDTRVQLPETAALPALQDMEVGDEVMAEEEAEESVKQDGEPPMWVSLPDRPSRFPELKESGNGQPVSGGSIPTTVGAATNRVQTIDTRATQTPIDSPPDAPTAHPATPASREPAKEEPGQQPPLLFEIAWEVCWQLGGIYTVLRSKAVSMLEKWDDRYCLIGPYNPQTAAVEFEERPTEGYIRATLDRLRGQGIPCHYGRWLVAGRPRVILLDYRARYGRLDGDKFLMWNDHRISIPASDGEVNDVVAFGFTVAEFFRELSDVVNGGGAKRPILAHFHEWMGGVAVPRIAHMRLPVSTIFTTHATLLGRYLASNSNQFYNHLPFVDPEAEANRYMIYPRFAIERAAAHASTVFTTVSEVTATEAERLLGRKPDVILPNGLNIQRFAALHEFQNLHRQYKERIHEFVMGHFFSSYTFDLDNTLYFFTSGRYEYTNKGMDLFIEALWRLNQRLRGVENRPTIVAFIITRAATRNVSVGTLQAQSMFEDLEHTCDEIKEEMGKSLFLSAARGRLPTIGELIPDDAVVRLKRAMHAWRNGRQPPIVTHDLVDDAGDPILRHLRHRGLFNSAEDPVKMVFHPEFVSATSPLLSLDYDNFVRGCHLGIFPSYYEPWGYTPMESIALGVPAVTTDLSGFGAYVERHVKWAEEQGVVVLNRRTKGFDESADELADYMFHFAQMTRRQRIELRNRVERLSELFDWSALVKYYEDAHNLALERIGAPRLGKMEIRMI